MKTFCEIIEYTKNCKNLIRYIKQYGDNLEFETWIYSDTIKINDCFVLDTPDLYFAVMRYETLLIGETHYRFELHKESWIMRYPKHKKLFDILFAPRIFKTCATEYKKQRAKQK